MAVVKKRIGEMLLEAGIIDEAQLKAALGHQRRWGGRLGQALVDLKLASEANIVEALARKFGFERARFDALEPYALAQAVALVPREVAVRNNVHPLAADTSTITVAMSDPTNLNVVDELRFRTGRRVVVKIGGDREISEQLKIHYPSEERRVEAIALELDPDEASAAVDAVFDPFGGGSKDALEAFFNQSSADAAASPSPFAEPPPAVAPPPPAPPAPAAAAPPPAAPRPAAPPAAPAPPARPAAAPAPPQAPAARAAAPAPPRPGPAAPPRPAPPPAGAPPASAAPAARPPPPAAPARPPASPAPGAPPRPSVPPPAAAAPAAPRPAASAPAASPAGGAPVRAPAVAARPPAAAPVSPAVPPPRAPVPPPPAGAAPAPVPPAPRPVSSAPVHLDLVDGPEPAPADADRSAFLGAVPAGGFDAHPEPAPAAARDAGLDADGDDAVLATELVADDEQDVGRGPAGAAGGAPALDGALVAALERLARGQSDGAGLLLPPARVVASLALLLLRKGVLTEREVAEALRGG